MSIRRRVSSRYQRQTRRSLVKPAALTAAVTEAGSGKALPLARKGTSEAGFTFGLTPVHFRLGHLLRVSGAVWQGEGGGAGDERLG